MKASNKKANNKNNVTLSIIMPVYENEGIERYIKEIHEKIVLPFEKRGLGKTELIIAEDGSKDRTREILLSIRKKYNLILNLCDQRRGYIKAVREIYIQAAGKYIFFTDADGEHYPEDFWRLWDAFSTARYDIVLGYKLKRKPYYRLIISKINNFLLGILFGVWLRDANCGFRILKQDVARKIIPLTGNLKAAYNAETLVIARKRGYKYAEVPIRHTAQRSVVFSLAKMPITLFYAFLELFRLRFTKAYDYRADRKETDRKEIIAIRKRG
jgi:glycosyltransferase involved in cell wall biosynthesis